MDSENTNTNSFKCHFCTECDGNGCIGEMPGMGGFASSINFQKNCAAWNELAAKINIGSGTQSTLKTGTACGTGSGAQSTLTTRKGFSADSVTQPTLEVGNSSVALPRIRLAPITGGVENVGYSSEETFYFDLINAVAAAGVNLSIGDGCPDVKLQTGIRAVEMAMRRHATKGAAVFIKPYPDERIFERMEWSRMVAEIIGVDIDSYNIVTMRNLVHLEKKSAADLCELKEAACMPFAIKGIFTNKDIDLIKAVKPQIVAISNHGGRVENRIGSTAEFLAEHGKDLAKYCDEIWVDGGIRKPRDLQTAALLGASEVMIGRPFITALCRGGASEVQTVADFLRSPVKELK